MLTNLWSISWYILISKYNFICMFCELQNICVLVVLVTNRVSVILIFGCIYPIIITAYFIKFKYLSFFLSSSKCSVYIMREWAEWVTIGMSQNVFLPLCENVQWNALSATREWSQLCCYSSLRRTHFGLISN